ncbi:MAG: ATP-binding cassette domain-containing protein [Gammaproteobacteria bacterium]|nr:ATP-binding cassette domain-containing protein [Gammaproteobacteria bacterium]NIR98767.1 ATP-binding cassette domain-containing protein [Gammaproteobacteria bacterium]NIT64477.1 ATP-binding cassette domain-containing protein [Gammaproteobacteria bacterium]NIV21397.1 ATP-binding cassette domain-containing protein [Gammaproteobacteria bacterium]NIX11267.1 ATP-binding cassette domain-containing protein [Gammaproteobacteria bacterium]
MEINDITVIGGRGRDGKKEPLEGIDLRMGDVASIVGPTGSGKTELINDIGLFADGSTPTGRRVLINGTAPSSAFLEDPSKNPVALITQHTSFLSDLPVHRFLRLHAKIRKTGHPESVVEETLDFVNQLTGEPINVESAMTELSGGQSRALLIADAVIIGNSPIILLDEIENAGIDRVKALELLRRYKKVFIFVTHDLSIALLSNYRLVMRGGAMQKLIYTEEEEKRIAERIRVLDELILHLRERIRAGDRLAEAELRERLQRARDALGGKS